MGCGPSRTASKPTKSTFVTSKAVVLLFYLPGNAKEDFSNMLATQVGPIPGNKNINFRFLDVANQRSYRRLWTKELSSKNDRAAAIYIADIREKPYFFLNTKTANWFVKVAGPDNPLTLVVICNDDQQLDEFNEMTSFNHVKILPMCENKPDTVYNVIDYLSKCAARYLESKKSGPNSPHSQKSYRSNQ